MNRSKREHNSTTYAQRVQNVPHRGHQPDQVQRLPVTHKLSVSWKMLKLNPLIAKDRNLSKEEVTIYTAQLATNLQTALFFSQDELSHIMVLQDMICANLVAFEQFIRATQQYFLALASMDGTFIAKMLGVSNDMSITYDKNTRKVDIVLSDRPPRNDRPRINWSDAHGVHPITIAKKPALVDQVAQLDTNATPPEHNNRQRPRGGKKLQKNKYKVAQLPPLPEADNTQLMQLLSVEKTTVDEVPLAKQKVDFSDVDWA